MLKVLGIMPAIIPSAVISVIKPLAELERRGEIRLRLQLSTSFSFDNFDWCDVVVFCRNCEIADLGLLYTLKLKGKKIVFEIDDNFKEIPIDTNMGLYHRQFFRLHVLRRFYELSDVTRVLSDRLYEQASSHHAIPQKVRSYFDLSIVDGLTAKKSDARVIKMAFPSSRIDNRELGMEFYSAVTTILLKYPGKIELHLWGLSIPRPLVGIDGVVLNKPDPDYKHFVTTFFQSGFDIGLAPGNDNVFFHSKTNNKYREFGGCGIAGVYSNVLPYTNSVVHKVTGLLVENTEKDWVEAIELLIADKQLRTNIQQAAKDDVIQNYSFNSILESWRECFRLLKDSNRPIPKWIYPSKHRSLFSLVPLGSTAPGRDRDQPLNNESIKKVCSYILYSKFVLFSNAVKYLNSGYQHRTTALFLVSNIEHLTELKKLLPLLSTSAIIDLTRYKVEIENDLMSLREVSAHLPVSFLLTTKQIGTFTSNVGIEDDIFLINTDDVTPFNEQWSLHGYSAAYLDLFERHVNYCHPTKEMIRVRTRLSFITVRVRNRYIRYSTLTKKVIESVKFRLGLRRF